MTSHGHDPAGASAQVLAAWVPGPFVSGWFLSIDRDGAVLASATSQLLQINLTARIALDTGSPLITSIFPDVGSIFTTPAVDDNGYSVVVGGAVPNSLAIHRFSAVSGLVSQPETCDQLAQLEKMGH